MTLFGWLKKKKKGQKIRLTKHRQSVIQDTAAATAFAEAGEHETARTIIDDSAGNRKILVIGRDGRFSELLVEYSLNMAQRLGYELVALSVTDVPLTLSAAHRDEATDIFRESSIRNVSALKAMAEKKGVAINHLIEIGHVDKVVDTLHAQYPGMRYVLTEPDPEVAQKAKGMVDIPVIDLGCYHNAAV